MHTERSGCTGWPGHVSKLRLTRSGFRGFRRYGYGGTASTLVTLIVLASIGLVEYILQRPEGDRGADAGRTGQEGSTRGEPEAANLYSLGSMLESHGRGAQPENQTQAGERAAMAASVGGGSQRIQ